MSHIFVAYARKDIQVARKIIDALAEEKVDTWIDWGSIPLGVDWQEEITRGIEEADAFIFLISPDGVRSEWCLNEIEYAVKNNKRILPIVVRDTPSSTVPAEISKRNWVFCRDGQDDFAKAIDEIKKTIHTDYDWLKYHTSLQVRALLWERNKDSSRLLRGKELVEAEQQLARTEVFRDPQPTSLQRIYVLESRRASNQQTRWRVAFPLALNILLILSMGSYIAYLSRQLAILKAAAPTLVTEVVQPVSTSTLPTAMQPTPNVTSTLQPTLTITPSPIAIATAPTQQANQPSILEEIIKENQNIVLVSIIVSVGGFILAFGVFFISASRFGTTLFSRSWLKTFAEKFSQAFPGAFKRVMFIGYKNRLLNYKEIETVRKSEYFGLPAIDNLGNNILPDKTGKLLDDAIVNALEPCKPVIIIGDGGAGKSTLLARLVILTLTDQLSPSLKGFRPIFITPPYYDGNLLEAITVVLRERDHVGVNTNDVHAQLESGKFLILFDGISEIEGDQAKGFQDILRIARNSEYENCRFIFTSRPGIVIPSNIPIFQLKPLEAKLIKEMLPRYKLGKEQEYQISQQLDKLEMKTIEPLLFSMILAQSEGIYYSKTRSQLYEQYFRRLLKIDSDVSTWKGWKMALENLAKWFTLDTGRRGVGIPHEKLVSQINDVELTQRLEKNYHLLVNDGWELLMRLNSAGFLTESRRWRFKHDTFEEYFAANYVISQLVYGNIPDFSSWVITDDQQRSFLNILRFISEIAQDQTTNEKREIVETLLESNMPQLWKSALQQEAVEAE